MRQISCSDHSWLNVQLLYSKYMDRYPSSKSFVQHLSSFNVNVHWNCLELISGRPWWMFHVGLLSVNQPKSSISEWQNFNFSRRTWEFRKWSFVPCKHSTIHMGSFRLSQSAALIAGGSIVSSSPQCLCGFWLLSGLSWKDCTSLVLPSVNVQISSSLSLLSPVHTFALLQSNLENSFWWITLPYYLGSDDLKCSEQFHYVKF